MTDTPYLKRQLVRVIPDQPAAEPAPVQAALDFLRSIGINFVRPDWLALYQAPGFPELTQMQVISVARQHGMGFKVTVRYRDGTEGPSL